MTQEEWLIDQPVQIEEILYIKSERKRFIFL